MHMKTLNAVLSFRLNIEGDDVIDTDAEAEIDIVYIPEWGDGIHEPREPAHVVISNATAFIPHPDGRPTAIAGKTVKATAISILSLFDLLQLELIKEAILNHMAKEQ